MSEDPSAGPLKADTLSEPEELPEALPEEEAVDDDDDEEEEPLKVNCTPVENFFLSPNAPTLMPPFCLMTPDATTASPSSHWILKSRGAEGAELVSQVAPQLLDSCVQAPLLDDLT